MAIQFLCSSCNQPIEVDDTDAGKHAACPYCRAVIVVPLESTYQPEQLATARPIAPPPLNVAAAPLAYGVPVADPHRVEVARRYANFALMATVLLGVFLIATTITSYITVSKTVGFSRLNTMSPEEMQQFSDLVMSNPLIVGLSITTTLCAVLGLILAIVSLRQRVPGNGRAKLSAIVCALFLFMNCGTGLLSLLGAG